MFMSAIIIHNLGEISLWGLKSDMSREAQNLKKINSRFSLQKGPPPYSVGIP